MDAGLDSGPIVLQERIRVLDGIAESELERQLAQLGGLLLVRAAQGLANGAIQPMPQDETHATSYSFPDTDDFIVTPDRSARWAYNFIRGVGMRPEPISIVVGGRVFSDVSALDFDEHGVLSSSWRIEGDELWLLCAPGVLHARVLPAASDERGVRDISTFPRPNAIR